MRRDVATLCLTPCASTVTAEKHDPRPRPSQWSWQVAAVSEAAAPGRARRGGAAPDTPADGAAAFGRFAARGLGWAADGGDVSGAVDGAEAGFALRFAEPSPTPVVGRAVAAALRGRERFGGVADGSAAAGLRLAAPVPRGLLAAGAASGAGVPLDEGSDGAAAGAASGAGAPLDGGFGGAAAGPAARAGVAFDRAFDRTGAGAASGA